MHLGRGAVAGGRKHPKCTEVRTSRVSLRAGVAKDGASVRSMKGNKKNQMGPDYGQQEFQAEGLTLIPWAVRRH